MTIVLSLVVLLLLGAVIRNLVTLKTAQNRIYLSYFIGHITMNFFVSLLGFLLIAKLVVFPGILMTLVKQLSFMLLILFSKAVFLKTHPKVPKLFILIFLTSLTLFVCNLMGYRFLPPKALQVLAGYEVNNLTVLYRDSILFLYLSNLIIMLIALYDFSVQLKCFNLQSKKSQAFLTCPAFYFLIIIFCLIFVISAQLFLYKLFSPIILNTITTIFIIVELSFPLIIPGFLNNLSKLNFSNIMEPSLVNNNEVLAQLTKVITSNELFLDPDFSLIKMQFHSNFSAEVIRNSLKTSHYRNFKTFVNHFRILYAMRLIDEGYLAKHTTNSLSVDSGYKSPVTFFRAFKLQTNQTPIVYSNCNV